MQFIKLTIPGGYWDSQLYSGYLYLFGDLGNLVVIDWDALINNTFSEYSDLRMASHTAFIESNLFYEKGVQLLLHDQSIKETLLARFKSLSEMNIEIDLKKVDARLFNQQDNPLPFPHVDSEVYYKRLYVSLKAGAFYLDCSGRNIKDKSEKIWDTPTFDITASKSYTTIAFAAGSEGLFQQRVGTGDNKSEQKKPTLVSEKHCTSCKWADFNIYATSHTSSAFFASFRKRQSKEDKRKYFRQFDKVISADEIFEGGGFSWGVQDKLYIYRNNGVDAIKYSSNKDGSPVFTSIGRLPLDSWKGDVVSAEVAPFGTVIECENAIVVVQSNDEVVTISGEPVNWRVFSKSSNYTNQLHIIYEDRLEVYSFYNDYFVDQNKKVSGISVK